MVKSYESRLEEQLKDERKRSLKYRQLLTGIGGIILTGLFLWLMPMIGAEMAFLIFFVALLVLIGIFDPDQIII